MNDEITIEAATVVDREVMDAVARLIPQLTPSLVEPSAEDVQEIVASTCTTLLLASDQAYDGHIVGMLTLAVFRIPSGVIARIEDVVVDSKARGKGVGAALTRDALRVARLRGAQTVELTSRPWREAANRLYTRLGFQLQETNVYRYLLVGEGGAVTEPDSPPF